MRLSPLPVGLAILACFVLRDASAYEDEPKRCQYVQIAHLPVQYTGPTLGITIDGKINGKPASFLVDTGAWETTLTRTGADRHKLFMRSTGTAAQGIGGYARVYSALVNELGAGPAKTSRGYVRVLDDFAFPPSYDGIAGAPFLLQTDLEISLAEKELRFFRPLNCNKDHKLAYWDANAVEVPFASSFSRHRNPEFTVELNGKKLRAMIDTGARVSSVTLDGARRAGLKLDAPGVERAGYAMGVGEERVARWTARFDTLQIGAEIIRNVPISVIEADIGIDVLLGNDFLRSHRVLYAMSQEKLYISYIGGEALHTGGGLEPWMQKEADAGNADAQMAIANRYRAGYGVARDPAQARMWMERAAANGNPEANLIVGRGKLRSKEYAEAAGHLRKALDVLPSGRDAALWLYVARARNGEGELGRRELETAFDEALDDWPGPLAAYHLGKLSEEKLLAEARDDKARMRSRVCQARTHIAERAEIAGSASLEALRQEEKLACMPASVTPAGGAR